MRPVLLGLGANAGDAATTLAAAVDLLGDVLDVDDVSSVYATPPWPGPEDPRHVPQPDYLNLVVRGSGGPGPDALIDAVLDLEALLGRDRGHEVRWGPRPIDIDVLLHGDEVRDAPHLTLPHPRLAERAFVLIPALEVWPGGSLPDGRRLADLLTALLPVDDIVQVGRLPEAPTTRIPRPDGPSGPPAGFVRPTVEPVAREHGA